MAAKCMHSHPVWVGYSYSGRTSAREAQEHRTHLSGWRYCSKLRVQALVGAKRVGRVSTRARNFKQGELSHRQRIQSRDSSSTRMPPPSTHSHAVRIGAGVAPRARASLLQVGACHGRVLEDAHVPALGLLAGVSEGAGNPLVRIPASGVRTGSTNASRKALFFRT
jgi:hypothetical protein